MNLFSVASTLWKASKRPDIWAYTRTEPSLFPFFYQRLLNEWKQSDAMPLPDQPLARFAELGPPVYRSLEEISAPVHTSLLHALIPQHVQNQHVLTLPNRLVGSQLVQSASPWRDISGTGSFTVEVKKCLRPHLFAKKEYRVDSLLETIIHGPFTFEILSPVTSIFLSVMPVSSEKHILEVNTYFLGKDFLPHPKLVELFADGSAGEDSSFIKALAQDNELCGSLESPLPPHQEYRSGVEMYRMLYGANLAEIISVGERFFSG